MKFLCHLKIVEAQGARTTFVVIHDSYSTFYITPIQILSKGDPGYLSAVTVNKTGDKWRWQFESGAEKISERALNQILSKLEEKLEEVTSKLN